MEMRMVSVSHLIYFLIFYFLFFITNIPNFIYLAYTDSKHKETIEHDFSNHFKKTFIKTYEEDKLRNSIIIRK